MQDLKEENQVYSRMVNGAWVYELMHGRISYVCISKQASIMQVEDGHAEIVDCGLLLQARYSRLDRPGEA